MERGQKSATKARKEGRRRVSKSEHEPIFSSSCLTRLLDFDFVIASS